MQPWWARDFYKNIKKIIIIIPNFLAVYAYTNKTYQLSREGGNIPFAQNAFSNQVIQHKMSCSMLIL